MEQTTDQPIENLLEELRTTGYYGREPTISDAPRDAGTRVVASRLLEVAASQLAVAWLDLADGSAWDDFILPSVGPRLVALSAILNRKLVTEGNRRRSGGFGLASKVWNELQPLIDRLARDAVSPTERNLFVFEFLQSAMLLRQCSDLEVASPGPIPDFSPFSSNVHPDFYQRCIRELQISSPSFSSSLKLDAMVSNVGTARRQIASEDSHVTSKRSA